MLRVVSILLSIAVSVVGIDVGICTYKPDFGRRIYRAYPWDHLPGDGFDASVLVPSVELGTLQ